MPAIDISKKLPVHKIRKPKRRGLDAINTVVVHTTNSTSSIQALANYAVSPYMIYKGEKIWNHVTRLGGPTFFYHDIIKSTGNTFHCVDYENITFHAGNYNNRSIAIALHYIAQGVRRDGVVQHFTPTDEALNSLYARAGNICLDLCILPKNVIGHREVPKSGFIWYRGSKVLIKSCPGSLVSMVEVRFNITRYVQQELKDKGFYSARVDGDFGKLSQRAWVLFQTSK